MQVQEAVNLYTEGSVFIANPKMEEAQALAWALVILFDSDEGMLQVLMIYIKIVRTQNNNAFFLNRGDK